MYKPVILQDVVNKSSTLYRFHGELFRTVARRASAAQKHITTRDSVWWTNLCVSNRRLPFLRLQLKRVQVTSLLQDGAFSSDGRLLICLQNPRVKSYRGFDAFVSPSLPERTDLTGLHTGAALHDCLCQKTRADCCARHTKYRIKHSYPLLSYTRIILFTIHESS